MFELEHFPKILQGTRSRDPQPHTSLGRIYRLITTVDNNNPGPETKIPALAH